MNIKRNITLYVLDLDVEINDLIKQNQMMSTENIIVLQNGPVRSPFDDFMRSIIIAVYQYNIKEIVVVNNPNENRQKSLWNGRSKEGQRELQEKVHTLNYLFKNCKPEFTEDNVNEWFGGGEARADYARNTVNVIRQHPLIPLDLKISEISIVGEWAKVHQ